MGAFLFLIVAAAGFFIVRLAGTDSAPWRAKASSAVPWVALSRSLGLSLSEDGGDVNLVGLLEGAPVSVRGPWNVAQGGDGMGVRLQATVAGLPNDFAVLIRKADGEGGPTSPALRTGDGAFDELFETRGDEARALALLAPYVREYLLKTRTEIRWGQMDRQIRLQAISADSIETKARMHARTAVRISAAGRDLAPGLAANVLGDPNPIMRRRNFDLLLRRFPSLPITRDTALAALKDKSEQLVLDAARVAGGDEAFAALTELTRHAVNQLRRSAYDELWSLFDAGRCELSIDAALSDADTGIRAAAIRRIGVNRDGERLLSVLGSAELAGKLELTLAVAEAARAAADPRAESKLCELLAHASDDVKLAAATALGACGTVGCVETLLMLAKGGAPRAVRRAATQSVREIQSRLGAVDAGRISLAASDEAEGALSVSDSGGELALADLPDRTR